MANAVGRPLRAWILLFPLAPAAAGAAPLAGVLLKNVPHVRQKPDFCGEACAEMALARLGKDMDQDYVFDQSGLDPMRGRGCYTAELVRALRNIGFRTGDVWHAFPSDGAAAALDAQFKALHDDLAAGVPSIVCMNYDERAGAPEHFRLVLGYDADTDEVIYHEPAEENGAYRRMKRNRLLKLWPRRYEQSKWTAIRIRLEPGDLQDGRAAREPTDADYAQHVMELRKKMPPEGFTLSRQPPFVVVGDLEPSDLLRYTAGTVRWTVERLSKDFFDKAPDRIIDIWLFQDKASYEKNTWEIFGERPTTPFGYYSDRHQALIMNIGTGGGTLVHEIVHPFMHTNFADCPAWFNEGLASLYEQSRDRDGHIWGLPNWRLRGLQDAIRRGGLSSFETLCGTTSHQFYNDDRGANYAQARYLCYYLQEQGLLVRYYRAFHRAVRDDPTGYRTLKEVLGTDDMDAFKKRWEKFVLELRF